MTQLPGEKAVHAELLRKKEDRRNFTKIGRVVEEEFPIGKEYDYYYWSSVPSIPAECHRFGLSVLKQPRRVRICSATYWQDRRVQVTGYRSKRTDIHPLRTLDTWCCRASRQIDNQPSLFSGPTPVPQARQHKQPHSKKQRPGENIQPPQSQPLQGTVYRPLHVCLYNNNNLLAVSHFDKRPLDPATCNLEDTMGLDDELNWVTEGWMMTSLCTAAPPSSSPVPRKQRTKPPLVSATKHSQPTLSHQPPATTQK
eukprot:1148519-Pelagomonas_calceolata.AAC.7